jgi:hypothetical protein
MALSLPGDRVMLLSGQVMWAKRVPPQLARLMRKNGMGTACNNRMRITWALSSRRLNRLRAIVR